MTPAATQSLADWLLERIAEDERRWAAEKATVSDKRVRRMFLNSAEYLVVDPARVLAQCAAHRAIVEEHRLDGDVCAMCGWQDERGCPTLRALASIYRDHEGFREEWAL